MNSLSDIRDVTTELTLLIVDDEPMVRRFIADALSGQFREIIHASDGREGLKVFWDCMVDIIITDQKMPNMTGVEMIREIRKTDSDIPIILITAYTETEILLDAINTGVNQFLTKPVRIETLYSAIELSLGKTLLQRQKVMKQEAELLKYREHYHNLQQRLTLEKQQGIIRNDLYYKKMTCCGKARRDEEWIVNIRSHAFDVLSGDLYSIRKIDPNRLLIFLADAMGKGLSAFVSSAVVTAFMNYCIDKALEDNVFDLDRLVSDFVDYAKKQFSRDEALCALFMVVDISGGTLSLVNCGMPPLITERQSGDALKDVSEDLPITRTFSKAEKKTMQLEDLRKLLLMSDGVYNLLNEHNITDDLLSSPFSSEFYRRFISKGRKLEDDATFIFIRRLEYIPNWTRSFVIESRIDRVNDIVNDIEKILNDMGLGTTFIVEFINALSEMIMNSYEHGSLGIGYAQKNNLLREGAYEDYLSEMERSVNKKITVLLERFEESTLVYIVLIVRDEGDGFDTSIIKDTLTGIDTLNYRGIKITKSLVDEIYYNEKGNEVTLFKQVRAAKEG